MTRILKPSERTPSHDDAQMRPRIRILTTPPNAECDDRHTASADVVQRQLPQETETVRHPRVGLSPTGVLIAETQTWWVPEATGTITLNPW